MPRKNIHHHARSHLVNRAAVRRAALDLAAAIGRGGVITQVGLEVFDDLDAMVRERIEALVQRHPSAFKTLKP